MNLFNAIYSLYEQQPAIFWAALITIVFAVCVVVAVVGIKCGARDWLKSESSIALATDQTAQRARLQAATFAGPAVKGWRLDNFQRVSPEEALDVFNTMKRTTEQPVRVVGTGTRLLRVEVK